MATKRPATAKKSPAPKAAPMPPAARRLDALAAPTAPPALPEFFVVNGDAPPPAGTMYHDTARRINDGLSLMARGLCDYIDASATAEYPCDIHEIDDRADALAEMVRGVRELFSVPGCREYLGRFPAGHDFSAHYRG